MYISRLQVQGGFLDGLDLPLDPGLNVLIGARGTGKSSVLELIRYALGPTSTPTFGQERSEIHAQAVLDDGLVRLTLQTSSGETVLERTSKSNPDRPPIELRAMALSQNAIEAIGTQPEGRIELLDSFRDTTGLPEDANDIKSKLRSLTERISNTTKQLEQANYQLEDMGPVDETLEEAQDHYNQILAQGTVSQQDREALQQASNTVTRIRERLDWLNTCIQQLQTVSSSQHHLLATINTLRTHIEPSDGTDQELFQKFIADLHRWTAQLGSQVDESSSYESHLQEQWEAERDRLEEAEESFRQHRQALEAKESGIGAATRSLESAKETARTAAEIKERISDLKQAYRELTTERETHYNRLEQLRRSRGDAREQVARSLQERLSPLISIDVAPLEWPDSYRNAVAESLRRSGLQYNRLAKTISERMSPLEFVTLAESRNADAVATALSISVDRARRALDNLDEENLRDIVSCSVEDWISFYLLDGTSYKETSSLSIGQRCTTILPILLEQPLPILLLDQPEDNLDNTFIASTLIQGLQRKKSNAQVITASHNANVPVLAEADSIVHLESDGHRGFVTHQGALDDGHSVEAITSVMEGGREAFDRRARFYGRR